MKLPINKLVNNTGQIDGVPANPRIIKKEDYNKLIKSLQEDPDFLNHKPLHVYQQDGKYVVLGGNQRLKALKELDYKEVPCTLYKPETPPEVLRARVMKDNAESGSWDMDMLANEWSDFPLAYWGVDLPEDWLQDEQEVIEDEAPEVDESEPPKSKLGEIYQLGRHRIMCGDATAREDVKLLMNGNKADMIFIDPPYNVDYTGKTKDALKIEGDNMSDDKFRSFLYNAFVQIEQILNAGRAFYIAHADMEGYNFRGAVVDSGLLYKQSLVWVKQIMVLGRQDYQWQHEPILYGWKAGGAHKWYGNYDKKTVVDDEVDVDKLSKKELLEIVKSAKKNTTVIREDKPLRSEEHPTMKPIGLIAKFIWNSSQPEELVVDTFLGSGSTLIACEQTDRTCYGCELDPRYIDVIIRRFVKFTNGEQEVIRLSDGKDVRQEYSVIQ